MSTLKALLKDVPVEWETLEKVTVKTNNIKWSDTNNVYRYIDLSSVNKDKNLIGENIEISSKNAPSRAQKIVIEDDVIFATTRPTQMRICLITKDFSNQIASTGFCVLRAIKDIVLPKWIFYQLNSDSFKNYLEKNQAGIAYPAISDSKIKEFRIPIPYPNDPEKSLAIQQEIVGVLDGLSEQNKALTTALAQEIDQRKKQYGYYREDLFRFEGKEVEWKTLGEVAEKITSGGTPDTKKKEYWENGTVPWMSSGEVNLETIYETEKFITEEGLNNSSAKYIPANSIVIALAGQGKTRGMVARTKIKLTTNQSLAAIIFDNAKFNTDYVFHYLKTQYINLREISSGNGGRGGLNLQMINKYKMPIPFSNDKEKSVQEQERIVYLLDQFDEATKNIVAQLEKEIELRNKQYEYYRNELLGFNG